MLSSDDLFVPNNSSANVALILAHYVTVFSHIVRMQSSRPRSLIRLPLPLTLRVMSGSIMKYVDNPVINLANVLTVCKSKSFGIVMFMHPMTALRQFTHVL